VKPAKFVALSLAAIMVLGVIGLTGCSTAKKTETTPATTDKKAALSGSITVQGSDTMVNLGQAWAEAFGKDNPGVMVSVTGGGSGTGIAALLNGTVDFADASRQMKSEEMTQAKTAGINPVETVVAKDGIAVIVNPGNKVAGLTKDQLGKIYRGEITNWKDVGGVDKPIVLLGRDSSSGTYEYFKEAVVGKDKDYAKAMRNLQSNQAIVDEVQKNADAIGYVGIGYADKATGITIVPVDGKAASVAAVLDGSYVLSRDLYMYSNGAPKDVMKAYVDWILSPAGQKIVTEQGFVPLTK
jgi:phosphate transport system substrate-binding protein